MAIDTAGERFTIVHVGMPWRVKNLPIPDGTINRDDRSGFLYLYTGFVSAAGTYISYVSASEWLTFFVKETETLRLDKNGVSTFLGNIQLNDANTYFSEDGSSNMTFTDAVTGTKTLAELAAGGMSITGTDNRIVRMDGTSGIQDTGCTIDDSDNVTLAGNLLVSGTGSHAIGTALGNVQFRQSGTFTSDGSSTVVAGHSLASTLVGANGDTTYQVGSVMTANITTQDNSETINDVAQLYLQEPNITKGATDTITNASTLWISSVPSEGASNYAILVDTGNSQFGGEVYVNHASSTYGAAGLITQRLTASDTIGLGIYNATQKWDFVNIVSGTPDYFGIRDSTNGNMSLRIEAGYTSGSILVLESDGSATFGDALVITDKLTVNSISAGVADYDKFLVSDGGEVKFRTGAEVLSDIGAGSGLTIGDAISGGTANRILWEGAGNTLTESANLTFNGNSLAVSGNITIGNDQYIGSSGDSDAIQIRSGGNLYISATGGHSVGGSPDLGCQWQQIGTYNATGSTLGAYRIGTRITAPNAAAILFGSQINANFITQNNSETINTITQLRVDEPSMSIGTDTVVQGCSVWITGAPTEATNNYALLISSGDTKLGGNLEVTGNVVIGDGSYIGSASATTALQIEADGDIVLTDNLFLPDAGYIGTASDPDALQIEAAGNVLLTQELEVDGHVGLGAQNTSGDYGFNASYTDFSGGVQCGFRLDTQITSSFSMYAAGINVRAGTAAAVFTCDQLISIDVSAITEGATSTITETVGLNIGNMSVGGTNYAIKTSGGLVKFGDDVGIGRAPTARLDVYESSADVNLLIQTGNTNGEAVVTYTNDAQTWTAGVTDSDDWEMVNVTLTDSIPISVSAANSIVTIEEGFFLGDDKRARFGNTSTSPDAYIEWDTAVLGELLAYVGSGDIHLQAGSGDIVLEPIEANNVVVKEGELTFSGTARIGWTKITANSLTLTTGTSANSVSDLQTAHDGNTYDIAEAASTPGMDMYVEFISVDAFNWVQIIAHYDGSATHSVSIEVYNWSTTSWNTFDSQDGIEATMTDHSFFLPDDTNYIGTGGNDGKVRVRFDHTQSGNASHDLYIDVVALYQ